MIIPLQTGTDGFTLEAVEAVEKLDDGKIVTLRDVSERDWNRIKAAASLRAIGLTEFVIGAASAAADAVLGEASRG